MVEIMVGKKAIFTCFISSCTVQFKPCLECEVKDAITCSLQYLHVHTVSLNYPIDTMTLYYTVFAKRVTNVEKHVRVQD